MDPTVIAQDVLDEDLSGLCKGLHKLFPGKSAGDVQTPVMAHDLFPTILDCTGADVATAHDGVSLVGALSGEALDRGPIYWHFPAYLEAYNRTSEAQAREPGRPFRTTPVGAIRDGQWKLLEFFEDGGIELYDLNADPGETQNLAQERPVVAEELRLRLQQWRNSVDAPMPERMQASPAD